MIQGAKKLLSGSVLVVGLQAINFILLARLLGPSDFGTIATASAFAAIALPVAGLGFGNVLLMKAARHTPELPTIAGNALVANLATGLAMSALALLFASIIVEPFDTERLQAFSLILITELVLLRTATVTAQLYSARSKFGHASSVNVASSIIRLMAIAGCFLSGHANISGWSMWLFLLSLGYATLLSAAIKREAGGLGFCQETMKSDLKTGISFSLGTLCKAAYTDGDKIILARYHEASSVGLYASAYRLASMAFMPVRALLDAAAYRFFQEGNKGLNKALAVSWNVMKIALPYTAIIGVILFFGASLVPFVLGSEYQDAVIILQIIAILPFIQAIHYTLSDALTGANMQGTRTKAQLAIVAFYTVAALFVIPDHGPIGAAIVCVASEGLLALIIGTIILIKRKSSKQEDRP